MSSKNKLYLDVMCISEEDTASCHLCVVKMPDGNTFKFIINCVLSKVDKPSVLSDKFPFKASDLDFVLITHGDADHMTRLPLLSKMGFENTIYTSSLTKRLMQPSLVSSLKTSKKEAKKDRKKFIFKNSDLNNTLSHVGYFSCFKEIEINENIRVIFVENSNMPGSAMIFIRISYPGEKDTTLFLFDNSPNHSAYFDINKIPKFLLDTPITIITELNYNSSETSHTSLKTKRNQRSNDFNEILKLLKHFTNIKLLLISNGEETDREIFAEQVKTSIKPANIAIESKSNFYRIGPEGLIKRFSSKF